MPAARATSLPFSSESEALNRERLTIHTDDVAGIFDVKGLMASLNER